MIESAVENADAQEGPEAGAGGRHRRRHLRQEGEATGAPKQVPDFFYAVDIGYKASVCPRQMC